jgi:hypothetical protein
MRICSALANAAAIVAVLGFGGCSLFGSDDKAEEAAANEAVSEALYAPIEAVRHIEIGRTRNGYVISVLGIAPGLGYGAPELRARREGGPGPDGFIDFDFVAQAPDPKLNLGVGDVGARGIRADRLVTAAELHGATGIRVHGLRGGLQMRF